MKIGDKVRFMEDGRERIKPIIAITGGYCEFTGLVEMRYIVEVNVYNADTEKIDKGHRILSESEITLINQENE